MFNLSENCSVCISSNSILIRISESDTNKVKWSSKLNLCVPEVIWSDDCCICPNCIEQLEISYTFYQLCIQSYEVRKQQASFTIIKTEEPFESKEMFDFVETENNIGSDKEMNSSITEATCYKEEASDSEDLQTKSLNDNNEKVIYLKTEELCSNDIENPKKIKKSKYPKKCDHCPKYFNRKQHLDTHIRSCHTMERPYTCDLCDKRFLTLHNLNGHKKTHTNRPRYICSACGKTFATRSGFYEHKQSHSNKRECKCTLCGKSFNTKSILRAHNICMHVDPKLWKYSCTFCEKRFPMNSGFLTHVRRHTGEKNFSCHICVKRFVDKDSLIGHLRSHTDERLFKCNLCEKEYKAKRALTLHLKKHHDVGTAKLPKPAKKFQCHLCSKAFVTGTKLERHVRTHTGERPFTCNVCKKNFTDGWYLKVHLKNKHGQNSISDNSECNLDNS